MACEICKKPYVPPIEDSSFAFDEKPHLCKICGKTFSLKIQLKRHLLSHEGNVPYVCNACEKHPDQSSYNLRLSKKGNFVCETCNKCFTTKRLLLRHAGEHTIENILNCDECGESFKNMTALKKHAAVHKPSKSNPRNARKDSNETSYQCEECGKCFVKLKHYEAHCLNHKKYHCNECSVYFASNDLLQEHLDTGSCQSRFSKQSPSGSPNSSSNGDEIKKHVCNVCEKSFTRKSALEGHVVTHFVDNHESSVEDDSDKDMDFQCDLKNDKTNELCLPKLKIKRSFPCEKCTLVFPYKISLSKHMLLHKENDVEKKPEFKKIYLCRICDKKFDSKENYKQHKLSHVAIVPTPSGDREEKAYTCQICLKTFAKRKHLKKHVRLHLDDNHTDESNRSSSNTLIEENSMDRSSNSQDKIKFPLSKREKREKCFSCSYCGKRFAGETCWRKHEAKHEKNDDDTSKDKADSEKDKEDTGRGRKSNKKVKTLICEYCNEDFTAKRHGFTRHRLSHTPEVCGICDARFTDRASLREHCRIHIGTEEGRRFLECSQKALDAKNGVAQTEPKVEYIYLVLR